MRVGIIGSGFGLYGLLPAFNNVEGSEVVCICGKKTERLETYCKSIGLTKIYSDWKVMLESENIGALAIAVTPNAQYEIAKVAIKKGLHIFAEKPLTANVKQAEELSDLVCENKVITAVDFIFPEIDEWEKAKRILDANEYGKLKHISVTWNFLSYDIKHGVTSWKTDVKEGGGALAFFGSHTLYYVEYFCGLLANIENSKFTYSDASKNGAEVGVDLDVTFENGVTGDIHISCNTPDKNTHVLSFTCERATLVLESKEGVTEHFSLKVDTENNEENLLFEKNNSQKNDEDERVKVVTKLVKRFIEAIQSKQEMIPSVTQGVRVQKLIDMVRNSTL